MSNTSQRRRIVLSVYLTTAVTLLGLGGELLVPGHHVHLGDPAGHHHHVFIGPHDHRADEDGGSRDALAALDDAAAPRADAASRRQEAPEHACSGHHESAQRAAHAHRHQHDHGHPHEHPPDARRSLPEHDKAGDPRGPPIASASPASTADAPQAEAQIASASQPSGKAAPPRAPDPSEPPDPDSTHDQALIDTGFSVDDPTPRGVSSTPRPRPTRFLTIAGLAFPNGRERRPGGARAPPSPSLV